MAQYAGIVRIQAPAEAVAGSEVEVTVRVRNTHSATIGIMAVGVPEHPELPPGEYIDGLYPREAVANVPAGATYSFAGYFTMPDSAVTVHAYSYFYGADDLWHLDDEETIGVALAELVPELSRFAIAGYQKV